MPVHGLAPQKLSPDKHVDVCVDSDEDRGSTPLASTIIGKMPLNFGVLATILATTQNLHVSHAQDRARIAFAAV